MEPKINLPAMFTVCFAGAGAAATFATGIGVPREKLWIAALVGAGIALLSFFVPSHTYTPAVAPPVAPPAPPAAGPNVTVTTTTDAPALPVPPVVPPTP